MGSSVAIARVGVLAAVPVMSVLRVDQRMSVSRHVARALRTCHMITLHAQLSC